MPEHGSRARSAPVGGLSAGRARPDQLRGGNHGLTPEQVAASQRERVLAAMRDAVAERGFRAVPVADAIARAGVSRKTFYELWASKEECFVAVYRREMERLTAPTLRAFAGDEAWEDRLRTALGVLLGGLAADPAAARICFVEAQTAGPDAVAARGEALAALEPLFARAPAERPHAGAAALGYLSEVLGREIAAGRTGELPGLRGELMRTLTLPLAGADGGGGRGAGGTGGDSGARTPLPDAPRAPLPDAAGAPRMPLPDATAAPSARDAGEPAFLARYGEAAAELLGRTAAAIADAAGPAGQDGAGHAPATGGSGAAPAAAAAAAAQVRAGVAAVLDFCAAEPDRARACFVEALTAGPAARERRSDTGRRLSDLFEQPLRALRPSDRIARVSAIALVGGLHELLFDPLDRRATADLPPPDTILAAAGLEPTPPA